MSCSHNTDRKVAYGATKVHMMTMVDVLEKSMAQRKYDFYSCVMEPVSFRVTLDEAQDDSVTPEGMAMVRKRSGSLLSGRTLHSLSDPGRVVKVG